MVLMLISPSLRSPKSAKLYRRRKLSPVELTRFLSNRIARLNPRLNAYLTVMREAALQQAGRCRIGASGKDRAARVTPRLGPLHGIPISLKDNIYTSDFRTTGGSQILRDFVPLHDAPSSLALKKAGADHSRQNQHP